MPSSPLKLLLLMKEQHGVAPPGHPPSAPKETCPFLGKARCCELGLQLAQGGRWYHWTLDLSCGCPLRHTPFTLHWGEGSEKNIRNSFLPYVLHSDRKIEGPSSLLPLPALKAAAKVFHLFLVCFERNLFSCWFGLVCVCF